MYHTTFSLSATCHSLLNHRSSTPTPADPKTEPHKPRPAIRPTLPQKLQMTRKLKPKSQKVLETSDSPEAAWGLPQFLAITHASNTHGVADVKFGTTAIRKARRQVQLRMETLLKIPLLGIAPSGAPFSLRHFVVMLRMAPGSFIEVLRRVSSSVSCRTARTTLRRLWSSAQLRCSFRGMCETLSVRLQQPKSLFRRLPLSTSIASAKTACRTASTCPENIFRELSCRTLTHPLASQQGDQLRAPHRWPPACQWSYGTRLCLPPHGLCQKLGKGNSQRSHCLQWRDNTSAAFKQTNVT